MGLLLLIPGIILLATDGWFSDQHTVGMILTVAGVFIIIAQALLLGWGWRQFQKT